MAGYFGIATVGRSIERALAQAFLERQPVPNAQTRAVLIRTDDLRTENQQRLIAPNTLSILLYRVDFNKAMRAAWSAAGGADGRGHLALDLHYLLTAWSDNAEHEHLILGRAMQAIEFAPVLSGPLLSSPALPYADEPQIGTTEAVQLALEEISTEALMRTFDSLPTDYRLTVPYVARIMRIDTRPRQIPPPVTDATLDLRVPA